MKRILYLFPADFFAPFYFQLSKYLSEQGYEPVFAAFTLRENLLLKKSGLRVFPENVFSVHGQEIRFGLVTGRELKETLDFAQMKSTAKREVLERRFLKVCTLVDKALQEEKYEAVVLWNGEEITMKAGALMARRHGIPVVYIENGYFPRTLQIDPQGVNINNSIAHMTYAQILRESEHGSSRLQSPEWQPPALNTLTAKEYLYCTVIRKGLPMYYQIFPEKAGNSWYRDQWIQFVRRRIPQDHPTLPSRFVFIPFQVHDDTQILQNSKLFRDMESFFKFVYDAVRRNLGPQYPIVVKEHPEDLGRKSYQLLQRQYPDVLWLRKFPLEPLLDRASMTFVINSSVGLQALERFHPVITFGESFYAKEELVFKIKQLDDIDQVIQEAQQGMGEERQNNIKKFIQFLKEHYFVNSSWKNPSSAEIVNAGERILRILHQYDPAETVEEKA